MARFWVTNSGTWDTSTTTHWAAVSNGAGGQTAPTSSDPVTFDIHSGTGTVTLANATCLSLDMSASTILTIAGNNLTCAGSLTLVTGMTLTGPTGTLTITGTGTLTSATNSWNCGLTINGSGITATLADNFISIASKTWTLTAGTFVDGGHNLSIGLFASAGTATRGATLTGSPSLTGNAGTIFSMASNTGLTWSSTNPFNCSYSGATGTRTISSAATGANAVSFNITAGTDAIAVTATVGSLNFTGFSGSAANASNLTIFGNLTIPNTMTWTAGTGIIIFAGTSGTQSITTNGVVLDVPITFLGVGGTFQLAGDLTSGATRAGTLSAGTFDMNSHIFKIGTYVSNTGATTLKDGGGTLELTSTAAGTVFSAGGTPTLTLSGTIKISGSTANVRTFAGNGKTYANIWITNATSGGEVDFTGSNTFSDFKQQDGTAQSIKLTAGTTTAVTTWSAFGTSGNLLTIGAITAANFTLTVSTPVTRDYISVSRMTGNWGLTLDVNSVDGGNNHMVWFKKWQYGSGFLAA